MKVLFDIGHPAHVHLFRCLAHELIGRGDQAFFVYREREAVKALLDHEGFQSVSLGKSSIGLVGKILSLFKATIGLAKVIRSYKPSLIMSHGSISAAWAGWLTRVPHIALEDTYNMEQVRLYRPFTKIILSGDYEHPPLGKKEIRYPGYHELAYLHKKRFTPDTRIKEKIDIKSEQKLIILRFVGWNASHDLGITGIPLKKKIEIVRRFEKFGRVIVSSEKDLPLELEPFRMALPAHKLHDLLASADLVFGESATVVSEAAVLGVFGVYLDKHGRYYTTDQEKKYKLVKNYSLSEADINEAIIYAENILRDKKYMVKEGYKKLLSEKIDVTKFLLWFIDNRQIFYHQKNAPINWSLFN